MSDRLVWIDLEMTGLDPETCFVIEIATIITDGQLNVIARGEDIVIHQADEVLETMNEWCQEHHGLSGLTQQVRDSSVDQATAEASVLAFMREHVSEGGAPLCGNSVSIDQRFLQRHMPSISDFLGDTIIDVTTFKELVRRWYPDVEGYPKAGSHRAMDDILESIGELQWYREHCLPPHRPADNTEPHKPQAT